ncbi:MAG TPA: AMP-binding protein [Baekduia sp.]|uniref:AMP-binding protein n=1 Tax=Baekduia sp. TaxID=2600305 RepID=UPI002D776AD5|nr:AMP-binding protein [Baekduia sp.]HET6509974.1 AMP-binding protein [Baekduia sp.]
MLEINGHPLEQATIKDVIRDRAARFGDREFAVIEGERLTYREADERANRVANALAGLGVEKGDVVVTYMYNSVDHVVAWFACAKLGAVWAPVNIALINLDLAYTLTDAGPRVALIDAELWDNFAQVREQVDVPGLIPVVRGAIDDRSVPAFASLLEGADGEPEADVLPSDPAGIIYTGGSTGLPKGVVVANLWYFPALVRYDEMFGVRPDDVHMGVGQMCHAIGSAVDVLCPFYYGLKTVMTKWFSASRFWDIAFEHRTTIVGVLIGPLMVALDNQPPRDDEADNPVRIASSGSGQVPRDRIESFKRRFGVDLLEIYGQTETGPLGAVGQRLDDLPYHSLGRPHGWCEVRVVDEHDQPCAPGVEGEITLRCTVPYSFMVGYHNKPDKFAEACRNLWFHSGDVGHLDENGYLHFGGRLSHSIRRRGENISALEVESAVLLHEAIAECAVVGVEADLGEEDVKVFVQLEPDAALEPGDLIRFLEERIAYFKVPRYVEFIDTMPRSATKNEIERFKLRERGVGDAWDRELAGFSVRRRV